MKVAAKLLKSSVVFVSGCPRMSRFNYPEIINNNISIHCNVNTNDGDLGSLRHLYCALTDARAARPRVCQASRVMMYHASQGTAPLSQNW